MQAWTPVGMQHTGLVLAGSILLGLRRATQTQQQPQTFKTQLQLQHRW